MADIKDQEEIELLRKEVVYSREAANITASLVVDEFVKREELMQRLLEKSRIEQGLNNVLEKKIVELQSALEEIKTLKGIIPICANCKQIRDDSGYWKKIESFIESRSEAEFSHSICPTCAKKLYPDLNVYDD